MICRVFGIRSCGTDAENCCGSAGSKEACAAALLTPLLSAAAAFTDVGLHDASMLFDAAAGHLPSNTFLASSRADLQTARAAAVRAALLHALEARPPTPATTLQVFSCRLFKPSASVKHVQLRTVGHVHC